VGGAAFDLYIDRCQYRRVTDPCCTPISSPLDAADAEETARLLKVVADPARLRILSMLARADDHEICVCDLTEPLGLSQPTVSHHMKVLRDAGLTRSERRGKWVYHRLVPERLEQLSAAIAPHVTV
jgi:ArsR family transcriptional regulator, arsenate/arsenite/antimonite-responsive transcriptional repressor